MKHLKAWLTSHKTSQAELARLLGTSRSAVCHWLAGSKSPSVETLKKLQKVTGLSLEKLVQA